MFYKHIFFEIETPTWGWLLNSLTHAEERTLEEKSRVEDTIYGRVEKRIELKSRSD